MIYADVLNDDCITWLYCRTTFADIMQQRRKKRIQTLDTSSEHTHIVDDVCARARSRAPSYPRGGVARQWRPAAQHDNYITHFYADLYGP